MGPPYNLYQYERNAVFGQELESFSQKSGIIQSGINTMQTTFVLEMDCGSSEVEIYSAPHDLDSTATECDANVDVYNTYTAGKISEVWAYCMFDKVIAFDETSGLIRSEY